MKKLMQVGFFKELPHGDQNAASLSESKDKLRGEVVNDIVNYLDSGTLYIVSPGLTKDVLSGTKKIIGTLGILTDGIWAWPTDLSYYVKNYGVGLPNEFLEHMKNSNWQPDEVDVRELEL